MADVSFKDGIVYIDAPERIDEDVAHDIVDAELQMIREKNGGKPTSMIVDNSQTKYVSSEARKLFAETADLDEVKRVAMVGGSIFVRTLANFVFRMSKSETKMKLLATREDAIAWIKSEEE